MKYPDEILYQVTKPARYTGGEWNAVLKDWERTAIKVALIYPDVYEIGMSNMALPILYGILNSQPDVLAERAFAPWIDMDDMIRKHNIPLSSLETKHALKEFDVLGFSLGYELTYTNVLNMLHLAGIPVLASERGDSHPVVIAGGSATLNPEPMSDFIDFFVIGEGEEVVLELVNCLRSWKGSGYSKKELLNKVATIPGIYVPSLYQVEYDKDGLLKSFRPITSEAPFPIQRRIVSKLPPPPTRLVVPYIEVVHDRGAVEIQRGCTRGCRFCQAGSIYRPVRERSQDEIIKAVGEIISDCGYNEVSLVSLTTSDYPDIEKLVASLVQRYPSLTLSLPSLRINSASVKLVDSLPTKRKTGLTLAPEAGSLRLRQIINKLITEEEFMETVTAAFERGWTTIKLYFMVGLPGETTEDLEEIVRLVNEAYSLGRVARGKRPQIRVSLSTCIPKPHTAFQWVAQESEEELNSRHELIRKGVNRRGIQLSWSDPKTSILEAVLSRGDRRLGKVIHRAWQLGCTFDAWAERFDFERWRRAFAETGLEPQLYARRERSLDELLPWDHVDVGVTKEYLKKEFQRALDGIVTPDCRLDACNTCGVERWGECP